MKRLMLAIIVCAMVLSGCSSGDDCTTVDPQPEESATEIRLNADILGMVTRAPVSANDNITASFMISTTGGDYTTNAWNSTVTFVTSPVPTSVLFFNPARYYPVDNSTIYIRGYYPAGTLTGKSVMLVADETEDVMITAQASRTKATTAPLSFIFSHLLTQLQFEFMSGTGYPASGVNVADLVIEQQKVSAILDLSTATMMYTTKDLALSGTFSITTAGATVNNYPMVKSGEALSVAVTTSDGVAYPEAAISITIEAGKLHLITLTFVPEEITAAINVTAQQVGGQGSSSSQ